MYDFFDISATLVERFFLDRLAKLFYFDTLGQLFYFEFCACRSRVSDGRKLSFVPVCGIGKPSTTNTVSRYSSGPCDHL